MCIGRPLCRYSESKAHRKSDTVGKTKCNLHSSQSITKKKVFTFLKIKYKSNRSAGTYEIKTFAFVTVQMSGFQNAVVVDKLLVTMSAFLLSVPEAVCASLSLL